MGGDADSRTLRFRCHSARLESTPPEPIQVDGDPCGIGAIEVTVRPGALQVLAPRDRAGSAPLSDPSTSAVRCSDA